MQDEFLFGEEVSELTRVPISTLRFYRHEGLGRGPRSFKLGARVVYRKSDVEQWIEEQYEKQAGGPVAS